MIALKLFNEELEINASRNFYKAPSPKKKRKKKNKNLRHLLTYN